MPRAEAFEYYDELVGLAYTGINEPKPWQRFVERLTEVAQVRDVSVMITTHRLPNQALITTSDPAPHITADFISQVLSTDVMRLVNELEIPTPIAISDLMPRKQLINSELYQNYFEPFFINRSLLVDVWRDPLLRVRMAVDRTSAQRDFNSEERKFFDRLAKHLANSINLRSEMQNARACSQFYQQTMDQLGVGALFLNCEGQLVDANRTGSELLSQRSGLCLREGKPTISEGRSGPQFRSLLRGLLNMDSLAPQGMRVLDDNGNALLEIIGRRLPDNDGVLDAKAPAAVLLITSCRQEIREPCANLLRDLYGFTACEARLAKLLVQGYTAQEAADQLCVSINTVKTHLKGIFEKTGYNKQSQVVAILNSSAMRLM